MSRLIIISDPIWDDGIYSEKIRSKAKKSKDYIWLYGNVFSHDLLEPEYYREKWLQICNELSSQTKTTVVFNTSLDGVKYLCSDSIKLFDSVHCVYVTSNDDTLNKRLEVSCAMSKGCYESAFLSTSFWRKRSDKSPFSHNIDISSLTADEAAEKIHNLIMGILCNPHGLTYDSVINGLERKLYIIDDRINRENDNIYSVLQKMDKDYILLNGHHFCNVLTDPWFYRKALLDAVINISSQIGKSIVLNGFLPRSGIIEKHAKGAFSHVQWICISRDSGEDIYPDTVILDTSGMSAEDAAKAIDMVINKS